MPFEALSCAVALEFQDVPPAWSPLVFPFDPDLPLFPLLYFHVLASDLGGERPGIQDRAYGYVRAVTINIKTRVLTADVICNKDLSAEADARRFLDPVRTEVGHRLGLLDRVTLNDVTGVFPPGSTYDYTVPVLREMWHRVVGHGYGGALPFGKLWDPVLGLARFYASWNPPGGRKSELIMTHFFCMRFGESVASGHAVPYVEFHLLPTWEELTDATNPLAWFPRFERLVAASQAICSLPFFGARELENWSFTGAQIPGAAHALDTTFLMDRVVGAVPQQHRGSLVDCFNAFDKGPPRTMIFLMFLNDVRQLNANNPLPAGSQKPRLDPARLSASDAADIAMNMAGWQSKKVVSIYAQQCHGNRHCFPMDTWIAAFLWHPLHAAEYNAKSGQSRGNFATNLAIAKFISSATLLGKVERLLWVTAQARKIHSPVCDDALWCVKASGDFKARGANPLTCNACNGAIRAVCPAYASIRLLNVSFNGSDPEAPFNIITSAADNVTHGQRFEACETEQGMIDEDTPSDWAAAFAPYPSPDHPGKAALTVEEFINLY
jgi:hypothetical protein